MHVSRVCLQRLGWRTFQRSPNGFTFDCLRPESIAVTKTERWFPSHISRPNYAVKSAVAAFTESDSHAIRIHSANEVKAIKKSSLLAARILNQTQSIISAGVTCEEIDDFVYKKCIENDCYPSPLNYNGFPKCVTTSVNNICVHGIPDKRKLKNGDIITVDVTVYYGGYHGDTAKTFSVGDVDKDALHLMNTAKQCVHDAITACRHGVRFEVIGETIERTAKSNGLNVIPAICGHGIGAQFHERPQIVHFNCTQESDCDDMKQIMTENMVFTIEPVITDGDVDIDVLSDGWTVITRDGSRTAQFEHTVCVKKDKAVILTVE